MIRFSVRVRYRDSALTGTVEDRIIINGVPMYTVRWDSDMGVAPRPFASDELEREEGAKYRPPVSDTQGRADALDRYWLEYYFTGHATVEGREAFRVSSSVKRV